MLESFDATSGKGISWYFRKKRMKRFLEYLESLGKDQVRILDLGGTVFFWERLGLAGSNGVHIVVPNLGCKSRSTRMNPL